jgi:hypothetical protein
LAKKKEKGIRKTSLTTNRNEGFKMTDVNVLGFPIGESDLPKPAKALAVAAQPVQEAVVVKLWSYEGDRPEGHEMDTPGFLRSGNSEEERIEPAPSKLTF